jgi:hypothetical protein
MWWNVRVDFGEVRSRGPLRVGVDMQRAAGFLFGGECGVELLKATC